MSHRACDFVTEEEYREQLVRHGWPNDEVERLLEDFKQGHSFDVHEFAELADGHRITLHTEREFTTSDHWRHLTLERLEREVLTNSAPDEDDTQDEHPWEWLAELLHGHGIVATPEELGPFPVTWCSVTVCERD